MGSEARCDYHILYAHTGFPPEMPSPEQVSSDLKKASLGMSQAEMVSQRDELGSLVNLDIWRTVRGVGRGELGSYIVLNFYKARPGQANEWTRLETDGWMPLAKAYAEEGPGRGWVAALREMPAGDDLAYNALTADIFPNWAALDNGIGVGEKWPKIHPDLSIADYLGLLNNVRTVHRREIFKVVELVRGK